MKTRKTILIILTILALVAFSITITVNDSDWKNILIGVASSSFVVVVIETVSAIKDYYRLANLSPWPVP